MNDRSRPEVAVVGAGIAGCSAAWHLRGLGADVTLIDARDRIGGRVESLRLPGGQVVELGAVFLTSLYHEVHGFLRECGPQPPIRSRRPVTYVRAGRRHVVPTEYPPALLRLPWLSHGDCLRFAREVSRLRNATGSLLDLDAMATLDFRTIRDWASERLGSRLYNGLLRPLLEPYLFAPCDQSSQAVAAALLNGPLKMRYDVVPGGMQRICDTMRGNIPVRLLEKVVSVDVAERVTVHAADGWAGCFDGIVVATPAAQARHLTRGLMLPSAVDAVLDDVSTVGMVHATFLTGDVDYGRSAIVIPAEDGEMDIRLLASNRAIWPAGFWPSGVDAVSVYLDPRLFVTTESETDEIIAARAWAGARAIYPALPRYADLLTVRRWNEAAAVQRPGRFSMLSRAASASPSRVAVAGDYLTVGGIEGAFRSGSAAADSVIKALAEEGPARRGQSRASVSRRNGAVSQTSSGAGPDSDHRARETA